MMSSAECACDFLMCVQMACTHDLCAGRACVSGNLPSKDAGPDLRRVPRTFRLRKDSVKAEYVLGKQKCEEESHKKSERDRKSAKKGSKAISKEVRKRKERPKRF